MVIVIKTAIGLMFASLFIIAVLTGIAIYWELKDSFKDKED